MNDQVQPLPLLDSLRAGISAPPAPGAPPRLVKMRSFGIGEGSTVRISVAAGIAILALWWLIAQTG